MGPPTSQPESAIHNFSHSHPLQLHNYQPQLNTIQEQLTQFSCCNQRLTGWIYTCPPCSYFLHLSCSQLPLSITHPCDQSHALSLLTIPPQPQATFNCEACGNQDNGFVYHCGVCNIYLHPFCAAKPLIVTHQSHHHQLSLTFSPPYQSQGFSCDICKSVGSKVWLYRCNLCEFDAHIGCATAMTMPSRAPTMTQQALMQQYQPQTTITQYLDAPPMQNYVATNNYNYMGAPSSCVRPTGGSQQGNVLLNQVMQTLLFGFPVSNNNQGLLQSLFKGGGGSGSSGGGGGGGSGGGGDGGGLSSYSDLSGTDLGGFGGAQDFSF